MGFIISIIKLELEIFPDGRNKLYIIARNDANYWINLVHIDFGFITLFLSIFSLRPRFMAVIPTVLCGPQLQNWWFRGLRYHFTDRCVRTPDTCRHSIEGVLTISVLSNLHSVINTKHSPYKWSEWGKKTRSKQHTVVILVYWWLY